MPAEATMAPAPPAPPAAAGRKPTRLTRRAEFLAVAAKGKRAAVHGLVLQALPRADQGPARLGFTVTRKVGNAVVRNRTRRRLKEAARLVLADLARADRPPSGVDLVLIGRDATRARPFADLLDDLRRALRKADVP
jgi:ribonuclease P protein component